MTKFYYACDPTPGNWGDTFALCNAAEVDLERLENAPKIATLNRWRVDSPKGFGFVLHAPSVVGEALVDGYERDNPELSVTLRDAWTRAAEQAHALAAKALLFSTPLEFRPGSTSRALIAALGNELAANAGRPVIWQAEGIWDVEATRAFASDHHLSLAFDPYLAMRDEISLGKGDGAFVLNERAGMRREFDRYDLEELLGEMRSFNRVFLLLRGRFQRKHAELLRDILS
ncbi:hypothetical protein DV096_00420 [Bradymonadaceae bacterium TMQ3]|uniref:DUF72 domain-containing protein n=1 Tax=Lujinxingia sediminis TaxID=2480984 RepID=A0ABY0CYD1_9DELT|nr:hypothetical protein [Lujinxingia sediminis]RDV39071.1 hypothetical protein DV096_00420 [Bradymonadaceae bacterium TMQ3]RVU48882.1 hypothetical protein EA187_05500 [Lujinxingia sediminis]TXC78176.1 hypothetical protein FRC91_05465 [Bradymonadales bacterium TMQ1]